jgi:peroxiredoxin
MVMLSAATPAASFLRATGAGDPLPEVTMTDRNGDDRSLAELRGARPLLLSFFSVTCKPCRKELPYLQSIHEKYGDRLTVLLVGVDRGCHQSFEPYGKEHGITFPVLHDRIRKVEARLGAFSLPKLILADESGLIRR